MDLLKSISLALALAVVSLSVSPTVRPSGALWAQMHMPHPTSGPEAPLGIPETRLGSGTSWLPDSSPMHASHFTLGAWTLMVHGSAFLQYDRQGGTRGEDQVALLDWAMLAASRSLAGGQLDLRGMLSTDPWGVGSAGYPLLLQTGESNRGVPLHDHQHPHDLFMEVAALYRRAVAKNLGASLYLAPVGEPAVGPVAFPHRPSAANDPLAPISHHWQDGTHITFGVLTAGVFTRTANVEVSWFNGREPNEDRTDFDYAGRHLDSYSARISLNPGPRWSLSGWYAYLKSPEGLHPDESLHRFGVSALTTRPFGKGGLWASALIWGANDPLGSGRLSNSVVLESNLDLDGMNSIFGRAEYVRKSAEDLVVPAGPAGATYDVGALALGYHRALPTGRGVAAGVGIRGAVNFVPASLEGVYGSRTPAGIALYLTLRPARVPASGMMNMPGMSH